MASAQQHLEEHDSIRMGRGRDRGKPLTPWLLVSERHFKGKQLEGIGAGILRGPIG